MIELACGCGRRFKVRDDMAGRRGKCPACGAVMTVPNQAPVVALDPAAAKPARTGNAKVLGWLLVSAAFGFGLIMAFVAYVNYEGRKYIQGVSNKQAATINEIADRYDAIKAELDERDAAERRADGMRRAIEEERREALRRLNEGFGHEPSTPEEFAEQRRLAIVVSRTFDNDNRPDGAPFVEITNALKLPGEGNWLFRTSRDPIANVVAVENGELRGKRGNEGEYVWAAHGPNAAARWYAAEHLRRDPFSVESVDVESPGNMKVVVRNKAMAELEKLTIRNFELHTFEPIRE